MKAAIHILCMFNANGHFSGCRSKVDAKTLKTWRYSFSRSGFWGCNSSWFYWGKICAYKSSPSVNAKGRITFTGMEEQEQHSSVLSHQQEKQEESCMEVVCARGRSSRRNNKGNKAKGVTELYRQKEETPFNLVKHLKDSKTRFIREFGSTLTLH